MSDISDGGRRRSDQSESRSSERSTDGPSQRDETLGRRPDGEPSRRDGREGSAARAPEPSPYRDPGRDVSLKGPGGKHEPAAKHEPGGARGGGTEARPGGQKGDSDRNQSGKADAVRAGEQQRILDIFKSSKSIDDFKLNLGLGPISDRHLGEYLKSKGFGDPPPQAPPKGPRHDGPSAGPERKGEPIVTRDILVAGNNGFERVSVTGTARQIADAQHNANLDTTRKAAEGLAGAGGDTAAARAGGADKFRGSSSPESGRRW